MYIFFFSPQPFSKTPGSAAPKGTYMVCLSRCPWGPEWISSSYWRSAPVRSQTYLAWWVSCPQAKRLLLSSAHHKNTPSGQELVYYLSDKSALYVSLVHQVKAPVSSFRALRGACFIHLRFWINWAPLPTSVMPWQLYSSPSSLVPVPALPHLPPSGNDSLTDAWA